MPVTERTSSQLELLPIELIATITESLATDDFKHTRLTCRALAHATRPFLAIESFKGMPWRNDAGRLAELSELPDCAARIRAVTFNFGELNEYKATHASFSHHYLLEPELRSEVLRDKWKEYYRTHSLAKTVGPFRLDLLEDALGRLPSLRDICLTWTRCPWEDEEPNRLFNPNISIRMAKSSVLEVQQKVLDTLWRLGARLENLAIEPMVLDRLSLPLHEPGPAVDFFTSLRRLSVVLERKSELVIQEKLELVLSKTPRLTHLRLDFLPWDHEQEEPRFLTHTHLKRLESVQLVRPELGLASLARFLARHAETIRELHLQEPRALRESPGDGGSAVDDAAGAPISAELTWDGFFRLARDRLTNLEDVRIEGTFRDVVGGKLAFIRNDIRIGGELAEDLKIMPARPLERYLLEGGEYPELSWE